MESQIGANYRLISMIHLVCMLYLVLVAVVIASKRFSDHHGVRFWLLFGLKLPGIYSYRLSLRYTWPWNYCLLLFGCLGVNLGELCSLRRMCVMRMYAL